MIEDPIILIGTDGSGTRVPTRALSKMGITILVDPEVSHQMDIDGSAVGVHFTKLIRDLLCITGGSDYQLEDLPQEFREHLLSTLRPWVDFVRQQACAAQREKEFENLSVRFQEARSHVSHQFYVTFGRMQSLYIFFVTDVIWHYLCNDQRMRNTARRYSDRVVIARSRRTKCLLRIS